jgi:hypothetical protein
MPSRQAVAVACSRQQRNLHAAFGNKKSRLWPAVEASSALVPLPWGGVTGAGANLTLLSLLLGMLDGHVPCV